MKKLTGVGENKQAVITLTTDFGDQFAGAQLKAVAASLGYTGILIENHDVAPYSIIEGAFRILTLTRFSPHGTIHVGVVDPGVGSSRAGIVIKTRNFFFVGPDNGLLFPAAQHDKIEKVWLLKESKISGYVSNTFHGRDVFIKAAIFLAQGKDPKDFNSTPADKKNLVKLTFQEGQILHIDNYGNVKIFWKKRLNIGQKITIKFGKKRVVFPVVRTFSDVERGQPLAFWGSGETLELALNQGNFAKIYNLRLGKTTI